MFKHMFKVLRLQTQNHSSGHCKTSVKNRPQPFSVLLHVTGQDNLKITVFVILTSTSAIYYFQSFQPPKNALKRLPKTFSYIQYTQNRPNLSSSNYIDIYINI